MSSCAKLSKERDGTPSACSMGSRDDVPRWLARSLRDAFDTCGAQNTLTPAGASFSLRLAGCPTCRPTEPAAGCGTSRSVYGRRCRSSARVVSLQCQRGHHTCDPGPCPAVRSHAVPHLKVVQRLGWRQVGDGFVLGRAGQMLAFDSTLVILLPLQTVHRRSETLLAA